MFVKEFCRRNRRNLLAKFILFLNIYLNRRFLDLCGWNTEENRLFGSFMKDKLTYTCSDFDSIAVVLTSTVSATSIELSSSSSSSSSSSLTNSALFFILILFFSRRKKFVRIMKIFVSESSYLLVNVFLDVD